MTKKVLISLGELKMLRECENCLHKTTDNGWFDAQPDWLNWIQNAARLMAQDDETIKSLLSKMETTGGEDDN